MSSENFKLLNWYQQMGIKDIVNHKSQAEVNNSKKDRTQKNLTAQLDDKSQKSISAKFDTSTRKEADKIQTLEELKQAVFNFDGLSICKTATNTVFADGNINAKIMVIGEAPGANEDEQGIPFCGQSGQLMDKMFSFIGLTREHNLYITNSIFWRPPGNRKPTTEESDVCLPFVEKHIALINPDLLILVGSTSAQSILKSHESISELRSRIHSYSNKYLSKDIPVAVLFHPSYLLRQPSQKKITWNDLIKIKRKFLT